MSMRNLCSQRVVDMLDAYSASRKREVLESYLDEGQEPAPHLIELAGREGEAEAWVVHDAYFMWNKPVANPFDQLAAFVAERGGQQPAKTWESLEKQAKNAAIRMIVNEHPMILPPWILDKSGVVSDRSREWWRLVSIVHQCMRQRGNIFSG